MELTDEEYNLISRYVDGELSKTEHDLFELSLNQNEELMKELIFYREVVSLRASVEEKLMNEANIFHEGKAQPQHISLITQARKNWENEHEKDLKLKYAIDTSSPGESNPQGPARVRHIAPWKWLAAAAFISFISLGIIWWNSQNRKQETEIAANRQKENASKSNEPLPSPENGKNNNIPDASTAKDNTTANSNLEKTTIEKANRDQLFTAYFTPDNSPESIEGPLEDALRYFKGKRYEEAIRAFNIVDFGPLSRGDEEESQQLLKFYASYYKGLSYLASDSGNANAAIKELKKAVSISPDKNWQRKAEWYLALAHIKNGNLAEAESLMKDVAGNNHSGKYKKQAIQLLDELHGNQHKN